MFFFPGLRARAADPATLDHPVPCPGVRKTRSISAHAASRVVFDLAAAADGLLSPKHGGAVKGGASSSSAFGRLTGKIAINDDTRERSLGEAKRKRVAPLVFEVRARAGKG